MSTYVSKSAFKAVSGELVAAFKNIANSRSHKACHVQRAKLMLGKFEGKSDTAAGEAAGVHRNTVGTWKKRVMESLEYLEQCVQLKSPTETENEILKVLSDEEKSGAPRTYTEEQRSAIIGIACTNPKDYDYPNSHMTIALVREIAIKMEVVPETISWSTVQRILDEGDIKPQKTKGWLNTDAFINDSEDFYNRIQEVTEAYALAATNPQGVHIVCVDEKTAISARERLVPDHPVGPGKPALIEHGYHRHGTSNLNAAFDVATGEIIYHNHTDTHKESDFLEFIINTIALYPKDKWIFICDNYSTHVGESIVRLVVDYCDLGLTEEELGKKRSRGILYDMKSRREFLKDLSHRISFLNTPPHASWMNQVEIWFSILGRGLINRGDFSSKEELRSRIDAFVDNYNQTAHPFKWTYQGKTLQA